MVGDISSRGPCSGRMKNLKKWKKSSHVFVVGNDQIAGCGLNDSLEAFHRSV
jgi:hypothetical protein